MNFRIMKTIRLKTISKYFLYTLLVAVLISCNYQNKLYTNKEMIMFAKNDTIIFCYAGTTIKGKILKNNVSKKTITLMRQNVVDLDYWMKDEIKYDRIKYCY